MKKETKKIYTPRKKTSHWLHFGALFVTMMITGFPFWIIIWILAAMETRKYNNAHPEYQYIVTE